MEKITDINQLDPNDIYSYADYEMWKFKERVELIKGKIFKMSPAPSRKHQEISWALARQLDKISGDKKCKMYTAPFDVRLVNFKKSKADHQIFSVVQPDLCIVCDPDKLDDRGCVGSPDLIIEILSQGNSGKEMDIKYDLYEENGVLEYWIVDPQVKNIHIYVLENGKYIGLKPLNETSILQSANFSTLTFKVNEIFES